MRGESAEYPRCFPENVDLKFLFRVDTSGKFGSTLVFSEKIKAFKIKSRNHRHRDKEIILLPVASPLFGSYHFSYASFKKEGHSLKTNNFDYEF